MKSSGDTADPHHRRPSQLQRDPSPAPSAKSVALPYQHSPPSAPRHLHHHHHRSRGRLRCTHSATESCPGDYEQSMLGMSHVRGRERVALAHEADMPFLGPDSW